MSQGTNPVCLRQFTDTVQGREPLASPIAFPVVVATKLRATWKSASGTQLLAASTATDPAFRRGCNTDYCLRRAYASTLAFSARTGQSKRTVVPQVHAGI